MNNGQRRQKNMELVQLDFYNVLYPKNRGSFKPTPSNSSELQRMSDANQWLIRAFNGRWAVDSTDWSFGGDFVPERSMRVPLDDGLVMGWAPNGYGKTFVFETLLSGFKAVRSMDLSASPTFKFEQYYRKMVSQVDSQLGDVLPFMALGLRGKMDSEIIDVLIPTTMGLWDGPDGSGTPLLIRRTPSKTTPDINSWIFEGGVDSENEKVEILEWFDEWQASLGNNEAFNAVNEILEACFSMDVQYIEIPKLSSTAFQAFMNEQEEYLSEFLKTDELFCSNLFLESTEVFGIREAIEWIQDLETTSGDIAEELLQECKNNIDDRFVDMSEQSKVHEGIGSSLFFDSTQNEIALLLRDLEHLLFYPSAEPLHSLRTYLFNRIRSYINESVVDDDLAERFLLHLDIYYLHYLSFFGSEALHQTDDPTHPIWAALMEELDMRINSELNTSEGEKSYIKYRALLILHHLQLSVSTEYLPKFHGLDPREEITNIFNVQDKSPQLGWDFEAPLLDWMATDAPASLLTNSKTQILDNKRIAFTNQDSQSNQQHRVIVKHELSPRSVFPQFSLWPDVRMVPKPRLRKLCADINILLNEDDDPWGVRFLPARTSNPSGNRVVLVFEPSNHPGDQVSWSNLSFGMRSEVVLRLAIDRFLFNHVDVIHQSAQTPKTKMGKEFRTGRRVLIVDEPEVGRSEYWVQCLIEYLNSVEAKVSGVKGLTVLCVSHRGIVLEGARQDGHYHNMHPVGVEEFSDFEL